MGCVAGMLDVDEEDLRDDLRGLPFERRIGEEVVRLGEGREGGARYLSLVVDNERELMGREDNPVPERGDSRLGSAGKGELRGLLRGELRGDERGKGTPTPNEGDSGVFSLSGGGGPSSSSSSLEEEEDSGFRWNRFWVLTDIGGL